MNKFKNLALVLALSTVALTACGNEGATTDTAENPAETTEQAPIEDTASVEEATTAEETTDEATTDEAVEEDAATEEEVVEGEETEEEAADAEMTDEEVAEDETTTSDADPLELVSEENPIYVDTENQTVTIYATYNGKYETEPTRHLVISNKGQLSDMAILSAYVTPTDFHQALLDIGAEAGDNVTAENAAETTTEGSALDLEIFWDENKEGTDINDLVIDSNGKPIDLRFSGNLDGSKEYDTGCISCLDSCFVGITSNASYPLGAIEDTKEVEFSINTDKAPKDKTAVALVYKLK